MMEFKLEREYLPLGTIGQLLDWYDEFLMLTVERPLTGDHPCVPEAIYTLSRYDSPLHGKRIWQLDNVPGRSYCQIHIATWPHELLGCIGLGTMRMTSPTGEPGVGYNSAAFKQFMQLTHDEEQITLEITHGRSND